MPKTDAELEALFTYHPPTKRAAELHAEVRDHCLTFARFINALPDCREVSLALTTLEEVRSWANAAIARNHDRLP